MKIPVTFGVFLGWAAGGLGAPAALSSVVNSHENTSGISSENTGFQQDERFLKFKIQTRPKAPLMPKPPLPPQTQNASSHTDASVLHPVSAPPSPPIRVAQSSPVLPPLKEGQYGFAAPQSFQGIPAAFVSLGNKTPNYGIVVEKNHHRLTVFKQKSETEYEIVKTYRAITGKDPGDKVRTGDLRTPEGIYFITGRIPDEKLPSKYGRLALTLDYPNIYDRRQRKSGYGIWIHATDDPTRLEKPFDTEGCVALSNEDVLDLSQFVSPFETPVVITKEMASTASQEISKPRELAIKMIESWRKSWEASDFDNYLKFYSKQFKTLGRDIKQWESFKKRLSEQRSDSIKVTISQPKILAFEDQLLAVFEQTYSSSAHSDRGKKFLYLQWEGDQYRIIAEKWYRL